MSESIGKTLKRYKSDEITFEQARAILQRQRDKFIAKAKENA